MIKNFTMSSNLWPDFLFICFESLILFLMESLISFSYGELHKSFTIINLFSVLKPFFWREARNKSTVIFPQSWLLCQPWGFLNSSLTYNKINNYLEGKNILKVPLKNILSSICHWSLPHHVLCVLRLHVELNKAIPHILRWYKQKRAWLFTGLLAPLERVHFIFIIFSKSTR